MPDAHVILILVEDELLIFLIDGVVGEVHAHVLHILLIRSNVGLSGESSQPFPEDEHSQWVYSCHQNVDAEVELQSLNQIGPTEVSLHHTVLLWVDVLQLPGQENALPLRQAFRLDDVGPGLSFRLAFEVSSKILIIAREVPGEGKVVVLFW